MPSSRHRRRSPSPARSSARCLRTVGSAWLLSEAADSPGPGRAAATATPTWRPPPRTPRERERLIALVELARGGDDDAFGLLYDHYQPSVYRFLYYRTRSIVVAEDLTSETFFRALRNR